MQDSRRPAAIHAALHFVMTRDMPSEHKAIIIEVLTQALRDDDIEQLRQHAVAEAGEEWQEHEIAQLTSFLQGRLARSWQHADESVMHLSAQLHRNPRSVRDKATELGLGASVDYRYAKAIKQALGE
jgi:glycyl-tRNA synthetase beta subunit